MNADLPQGERERRELLTEALVRTDLDKDAAARQAELRLRKRRPEDAAAAKELDDLLVFRGGVAALEELWNVDRDAAQRLALEAAGALISRGYRPRPHPTPLSGARWLKADE